VICVAPLLPLTGAKNLQSLRMLAAMKLAVLHVNQRGESLQNSYVVDVYSCGFAGWADNHHFELISDLNLINTSGKYPSSFLRCCVYAWLVMVC
jgi:hypothetical protein